MATYTDNYTMTKPTYAEQADISVINANMDIIDNVMHSSQISLAPAYDINETYNTGDIVMHELLMYKCLEDNVTGVWDSTKWTRTTAGEESGGGADLDIYGEASGTAEASFSDGAEASLVECEIGIVPTQDLHGYSKPWAGGAGKNKCFNALGNVQSESAYLYPQGDGLTITINNSTRTAYAKVAQNTDIVFSCEENPQRYIAYGLDAYPDVNVLCHSLAVTQLATNQYKFNSGAYEYIAFYYCNDVQNIPDDVMIEQNTQATTYEPYSNICPISGHSSVTVTVASTSGGSGEDTTVSLGRTVYGGTLDVTTGVLTVDKKGVLLPSLNFSYYSDNNRFVSATVSDMKYSDTRLGYVLSDTYEAITDGTPFADLPPYCIYCVGQTIDVHDARYTNVSDFNTALASSMVIYELATPQTFNLTPTQVLTLLGQNYVSHDGGGTISLVYIKKDSTIIPNPSDAEVPLTGLEISGKGFKITDARIPAPPTTNGAYVLTVTVSGGTPTYSWENA